MLLRTLADGKLTETSVTPNFSATADICVVGLGTAGALAAISAAEAGASVIGVERTAHLGGMGAAGCVWDYYYGTPGGMAEEINEECYRLTYIKRYASSGGRVIRPQALPGLVKSAVLTEHAIAAGCQLMLEHTVTGVYLEGEKICGLQLFSGSTLKDISCTVVIDCADGTVCQLAGCDFLPGRPSDNHTMTFSHMMGGLSNGFVRAGWSMCGFPDADNARDWTDIILKSYNSCCHDFYSGRILYEAALLGRREVYNVRTDDIYTFSDLAAEREPEKPLFYGFAPLDNTNPSYDESEPVQDWKLLAMMGRFGLSAPVPMGTLIPAGKEGLLVAGKAIGTGHDLSACLRMKFDMEKCGEAAGKIAALACRDSVSVRNVPYDELKQQLISDGCLDFSQNRGICDLNEPYGRLWQPIQLPKNSAEYRSMLASDEPGPAIWWARNHSTPSLLDDFAEWMTDSNRFLAENSAIALGIAGDARCLPMLNNMLRHAPSARFYRVPQIKSPYGIGTTVTCNYTKAICLLARFGNDESVELLEALVRDNGASASASAVIDEGCPSAQQFAEEWTLYADRTLKKLRQKGY